MDAERDREALLAGGGLTDARALTPLLAGFPLDTGVVFVGKTGDRSRSRSRSGLWGEGGAAEYHKVDGASSSRDSGAV